jgi:hypothetical protein
LRLNKTAPQPPRIRQPKHYYLDFKSKELIMDNKSS